MDRSLWIALVTTILLIGAVGAACVAAGRPDWCVVTLICGLTFLLIAGGGFAAARGLSSDVGEPIHRWSLIAAPFAVALVALVARTQFTPAAFTPDSAAKRLEIADLDHNLQPYAGHKVRFTGTYAKLLGRDTTASRLGIHDAATNKWAAIEVPTNLPDFKVTRGQTLEFIGVVEQSRTDGSLRLVAREITLVSPTLASANAEP